MKEFQDRLFLFSGGGALLGSLSSFLIFYNAGETSLWTVLAAVLVGAGVIGGCRLACQYLGQWCINPLIRMFYLITNPEDGIEEQDAMKRIPELMFLRNHINYMTSHLHKTTTELEEQAKQIMVIQESKINFIRNMFHEIRTPMNSVLGMCEVLQEIIPEEQRELSNIIYHSTHDLSQIVTNLITLSALDSGRLDRDLQWIELKPFVDEIIGEVLTTVDTTSASLEVVWEDSVLPRVFYDPVHLKQMVFSLARTPFKLTHEGTLVLRIRQENQILKFIVDDKTLSIGAEELNHIFERFILVSDADYSSRNLKVGVGLALIRELAEFNEGEANVTSSPEAGTSFQFTIPLARTLDMETDPQMDLDSTTSLDPFKADIPIP